MAKVQTGRLQAIQVPKNDGQRQVARSITTTVPIESFSDGLLELLEEPRTVETTHIPEEFLSNLALKILYFAGTMKGWGVAREMRLHFSGVVEPLLQTLKNQHLVQVTGGSNMNRASYRYAITEKGAQRARELLERNRYTGPCPVTLGHYIQIVKLQARSRSLINEKDVRLAMQGLVLSPDVLDQIGPAVNSFKSVFIYGPPGNGKTSIAKAIASRLLPGNIMIPHAIYEGGQVIKVFDAEVHPVIDSEESQLAEANGLDKRWVACAPPAVITGGELTLQDLDLQWSDANRYYEAPFQLKANGGMLLIDDFGRQQMAPKELLNRWIVPLEERLDFLTFHTGKKFAVPFETLIVFSTNLDPEHLVDEAFLRRIRHKMSIGNPTEEQFLQIFGTVCKERGIEFNQKAFVHLLREYYISAGRQLKACHPRDLLDQLIDFAMYRDEPKAMTIDLIDRAARSYFADLF